MSDQAMTIYVDSTEYDEFITSHDYAKTVFIAQMKTQGITATHQEAENYLAWCYDVYLTSLLANLKGAERERADMVRSVVSRHCRSKYVYDKLGGWPPPKARDIQPDPTVQRPAMNELVEIPPTSKKNTHVINGYL